MGGGSVAVSAIPKNSRFFCFPDSFRSKMCLMGIEGVSFTKEELGVTIISLGENAQQAQEKGKERFENNGETM